MKILILVFLMVAIAGCMATGERDNSQSGWRLKTDTVDLFITANGGPGSGQKLTGALCPPVAVMNRE